MSLMRRFAALFLTFAWAGFAANYLVLLKNPGALAFYDATGKLTATTALSGPPSDFVLSTDGRYAYVTDTAISIVDLAEHRVVGVIPLGSYTRPRALALDPATGHLLAVTEAPEQLLVLDTQKRGTIRSFDTKGKRSHALSLDRAGKWAYVSNADSGNVSAIELASGRVKLIQTGKTPSGSVLSPDGGELYVCNRDDNTITVIDTKKNAPIALIETGQGPAAVGVTPDGERLFYALSREKRIGIADAKTRKQLDYALLTEDPISLHLSRDGKLALTAARQQDAVYIVSTSDRHIRLEFHTAAGTAPVMVRMQGE